MRKVLFALLATISWAGFAQAATITGSIWENQPGPSANATPANVPGTAPNVTFATSAVNFSSFEGTGNYTIGRFLNAFNPATVFIGASELGNDLNNTIWDFKGTVSVTNGQTFNVAHDDGLTLIIGANTVINAPGPTAPTTTTGTYTGPTGTFAFDLVYGECCGPPAKLFIDLPLVGTPVVGQTPLPGALPLFATGLGALGLLGLRRKRKAAAIIPAA